MFITFESDNKIELVNAKSMDYVATVTAPQANNLAGIVVDRDRRKVYVIDRGENNLYIYSWDAVTRELTLALPAPYYVELQDCSQGYGLALDEENGRLYVGDNTMTVKYYSTNDWVKLGEFTLGDYAVGIAIDVANQYVYTGSAQLHSGTWLTKYDLSSDEESWVDAGSRVLGIAVNEDTSLVYLTTYEGGLSPDKLMIYNSALVKQPWESGDIGNPAGVCVPNGDISYKPDVFTLSKSDDVVDCVSPEDEFTYTINYGANGSADTGVVIIDYLPIEADYVSSDPLGAYNGATHTVTWDIGDISGSDSGTLEITVQVNYLARPGDTVANAVEMEGELYYSKRTTSTDICCWYAGDRIYVDKDATGYNNGTSWDHAYTDLQEALARARMCSGAVTAIWVAAGTYKPTEIPNETDATFEVIDGIYMYGHFGGVGTYETSIEERDFDNPANETRLEGQIGASAWEAVAYVVTAENITDLVFDGFTVRGAYNGAGILVDNCPNADLRIVRCRIEDNDKYGIESKATAPSVSHFELEDCVVTGNSTYGLVCNRSWAEILGTTFDGNNQTQMGINATQSAVDLSDSDVRNHTGSGIYADDADIFIEDCLIEDNDQSGVYSVSLCYVDITRSVIRANGWDGIYLENSLETKITDNWIYDNLGVGSYDYAGIYLYGAIDQAQIRNNTICKNNPHGIYLESGTEPEVVNCIVYDNTTEIGTDDELPLGTVSYSCIEGDLYPGFENINTDPLFLDEGGGDYHLTESSGCVDTGKPDSTEGGELDIDGNPRVMGGRVDMGADEDFPHCHPDYAEWVEVGRPDCWCYPRQCHGDADGLKQGSSYFGYMYVSTNDLAVLIAAWQVKEPPKGPGIATIPNGICADFNHQKQGNAYFGYMRVSTDDLAILIQAWQVKEPPKNDPNHEFYPYGIPGDCLLCDGGGESASSRSATSELSKTDILDWLAEVWLDPEVREHIDAEAWLKLYQSLNE